MFFSFSGLLATVVIATHRPGIENRLAGVSRDHSCRVARRLVIQMLFPSVVVHETAVTSCVRTVPKPDLLNTLGLRAEGKAASLSHWKHC
jgi:hypothetical protein